MDEDNERSDRHKHTVKENENDSRVVKTKDMNAMLRKKGKERFIEIQGDLVGQLDCCAKELGRTRANMQCNENTYACSDTQCVFFAVRLVRKRKQAVEKITLQILGLTRNLGSGRLFVH